jgi:hypothetical protein
VERRSQLLVLARTWHSSALGDLKPVLWLVWLSRLSVAGLITAQAFRAPRWTGPLRQLPAPSKLLLLLMSLRGPLGLLWRSVLIGRPSSFGRRWLAIHNNEHKRKDRASYKDPQEHPQPPQRMPFN